MYACSTFMYACAYMYVSSEARRTCQIPWDWSYNNEPPCSCWELNSGPLEEQPVLFTATWWLTTVHNSTSRKSYILSYLHRHQACAWCICAGKTLIYMKNKININFKITATSTQPSLQRELTLAVIWLVIPEQSDPMGLCCYQPIPQMRRLVHLSICPSIHVSIHPPTHPCKARLRFWASQLRIPDVTTRRMLMPICSQV